MTTPARELYLYWRTSDTDAAVAMAAVRAWQQALQADQPELQARLLRRADEAGAEITWMETYTLPGGIAPVLQQRIVDQGDAVSAAWRRGPRHVEVFTEPA